MLNLSFDNSSVETQKSDSSIDWCHYNLDCNVTAILAAILIVEPLLWFESQIQVAFRWISPVAKISILNDEVWHIRGGSMIFGLGVQISLLGGGGTGRGRERERVFLFFFCEIPFENEIIMAQGGGGFVWTHRTPSGSAIAYSVIMAILIFFRIPLGLKKCSRLVIFPIEGLCFFVLQVIGLGLNLIVNFPIL